MRRADFSAAAPGRRIRRSWLCSGDSD